MTNKSTGQTARMFKVRVSGRDASKRSNKEDSTEIVVMIFELQGRKKANHEKF